MLPCGLYSKQCGGQKKKKKDGAIQTVCMILIAIRYTMPSGVHRVYLNRMSNDGHVC